MQAPIITLISTIHKEIGKCNSEELSKIIESLNPDIIFLEANENSYSKYHDILLSQFGVYQERLEIKALQIYRQNHTFKYVPVLDTELSYEFDTKLEVLSNNKEYRSLWDNYLSLEAEYGFQYINSKKQITYLQQIKELEKGILGNNDLHHKVNENIDAYEFSMLRNIYLFCKDNSFETAIFMCGAAHRKTIIQKIKEFQMKENINISWTFYNEKD
jgi:hypothetical protein